MRGVPFFLLFLIFFFSSTGFAVEKKKSRTTRIEFGDEFIKGEALNPDVFYLLKRRQASFKKLIPLRENFLPEMKRTSEYIKSSRR